MATPSRFENFKTGIATGASSEFYSDVTIGLGQAGQKELPSKYLYDEVGSALFDAICILPEYGLTRAEVRILQRHAGDIIARLPSPVIVAELGSGSGEKTRLLLEALGHRQRVNYYPIDISSRALNRCRQEIGELQMVSLLGFERAYLDGLHEVAARRRTDERLLVLFLGSTIGNFDRGADEQFLQGVRAILQKDDALLLATDLRKPLEMLLKAYDDPAGVTAAFNKNLLARINRELGADFNLSRFEHTVRYDTNEHRIEMHLRSACWQRVTIRKANFSCSLQKGETIWTESSHKYTLAQAAQLGSRAGFECSEQWVDSEWPFAQTLFLAV